MELKGILRVINIKHKDTDTYGRVTFDIDCNDIDLNALNALKQQYLILTIKEDNTNIQY